MSSLYLDSTIISESGSIGKIGTGLFRIWKSIDDLFSGIMKFLFASILVIVVVLIFIIAMPFVWIKFWRLSKTIAKKLGYVDGIIEINTLEDLHNHKKIRRMLNDNLKVHVKLEEDGDLKKVLKRIPLFGILLKILDITAEYCLAVDRKFETYEVSTLETNHFKFVPNKELEKEKISSYSYLN